MVVGSGATGGWVAKELTGQGLNVLLLEGGPRLRFAPPRRMAAGWKARKPIQATCEACSDQTQRFFVDDAEAPYELPARAPFLWIRGRQLGGRTLVWTRQCYRLSGEELHAASRDGYGEDWPLSYRELAPYYGRVERFLGVTGERDGLRQLPDGVFRPPPRLNAAAVAVRSALQRRRPRRAAIVARLAGQERPSRRCPSCGGAGECGGYPYFSSPGSTLHAALATGRLTIRPNAVVSHVTVDPRSGKATGCAFVDRVSGRSAEARARVVVLCASTIESTRVLLNSRERPFPGGLGNGSGLLGRYLMDHTSGVTLVGHLPHARRRGPAGVSMLYVPWPGAGGGRSRRFLRGYGVQVMVYQPPPESGRPPLVNLHTFGEMLPRAENRVTLSRERDPYGIPQARIACAWSENEREMARDQAIALEELARAAGVEVLRLHTRLLPPGSAIHEAGTARMGRDPRRSVLDPHNRVWEASNVYVVDGACFPSIGFQNPTLTMMALAARAGDHIASAMRRREL